MKPVVFFISMLILAGCSRIEADATRIEAEAKIDVMRVEPTATAAALVNQERAIYVSTVVPAQAAADAKSIVARTEQQISEDAHQQALRHDGEMAALTISNTERLNEMDESHTAKLENIKASSAASVAALQADSQRSIAGAWRDTGVALAVLFGALILLIGAAWGIVLWINNRARLITDPETGPILVMRHGALLLGRVTGPAIFINRQGQVLLPIGPGQSEVTARQQTFALINQAMKAGQPEVAKIAERAASQMVQQQMNPAPTAAVQALALSERQQEEQARSIEIAPIPTFSELTRIWKPTIQQMLFAFDERGKPIYGSLDRLLSALVIGRQGQGKTTLLRLIYAQCAMVGVGIVVWDLHGDIADDLPGLTTLTTPREIEKSAREMMAGLDQRQRLGLKHDRAKPLMVLIDELNALGDAVPGVIDPIRRISAEGRKYRVFEFATAKGAPASMFGGSWARDSFSARFAFWTSDRQARMLGFEPEDARKVNSLTVGHALMELETPPAQIVTFPNVTQDDLKALLPASGAASRATSRATSGPLPEMTGMVSGGMVEAVGNEIFEYAEQDEALHVAAAKRDQVREMLRSGSSQREIIAQLWGAKGGRAYQEAARELNAIIQGLVQ